MSRLSVILLTIDLIVRCARIGANRNGTHSITQLLDLEKDIP